MNKDIVPLFCDVDDFCLEFEPMMRQQLLAQGVRTRNRAGTLSLSEIMTIIIWFQQSGYRTFKESYVHEVHQHLRWAFPQVVSYHRFVELMGGALLPLVCYVETRQGACSGISFIDSLPLCHNRRIHSHTVFDGLAQRGKNSVGWFYGFNLHLVVNDPGDLLAFGLTPGNVDDRTPVPQMVNFFGKLYGDRGSISQKLFDRLFEHGLQLVTRLRTNMKNKLMPMFDKLMVRQRALIETINDQLKNISQIEHTRHRSVINFFVNVVAALIAYTYQEKKPALNIRRHDSLQLPALIL